MANEWIPANKKNPDVRDVIVTVKDLELKKPFVTTCLWDNMIDMETGEILGTPTYTIKNTLNLNDNKNFKVLAWMPFPPPYRPPFKLIVAGSRTFNDYALLKEKMNALLGGRKPDAIVCGEAKGADLLGRKYAEENNIEIDSYPAQWDKYGKQAGYIRNEQMAENANALLAFWDGESAGTKHMIETAKRKGLQVRVIKTKGD